MPWIRQSLERGAFVVVGVVGGWALAQVWAPMIPGPDASSATEGAEERPSHGLDGMHVAVTSDVASLGSLPRVVPAAGRVRAEPGGEVWVTTRASGRVVSVAVAPGQVVAQGAIIARLDDTPRATARADAAARALAASNRLAAFDAVERARATSELRAAQADRAGELQLAAEACTRTEQLVVEGLASARAESEARRARDAAAHAAELADAALAAWTAGGAERDRAALAADAEAATAALADVDAVTSDTTLRAPSAGTVVDVDLHRGAWLDAGARVARIATDQPRVIAFGVGLADAAALHAGSRAWWTDAQGARHAGAVARVLDTVSSALGLVEVIVEARDGSALGPLDLAVRGELEVGRFDDAVLVPERAIVRADDARIVVIAGDDGLAHVQPIELLGVHAGRAAIVGDIPPGARVIVDGQYNLPDGARLDVTPSEASQPGSTGDDRGAERAAPREGEGQR
ncbi:MAG: HlyD family efflux transporter periplasmic adaptor subunit [Planctomycetota bacterium]